MDRRRNLGIRRTLVLLALMCLVKYTTEQKIDSIGRGGKSSNIVEKINGWRSQRGGSCLSYGHSCWGAHGKRSSAKSLPPDLDFLRILGRMASNNQMEGNSLKRNPQMRSDLPAIYRTDSANDDEQNSEKISDVGNIIGSRAVPAAYYKGERRNSYPEGIPMLDDDFLTQTRIWKLMKAAAATNEQ